MPTIIDFDPTILGLLTAKAPGAQTQIQTVADLSQTDLPALLNAVPIARDGDVITAEYHNSLRAALLALGGHLGAAPGTADIVLTFPPAFSLNDAGPNWSMVNGAASLPDGEVAVNGWFPVQLPHDARIQSLIVYGQRSGTISSFQVKLQRQTVEDGSVVSLLTLQLKDAPSPFKIQGTVNVAGAGPAALEEYRRVNNTSHTYFVTGRVIGAGEGAVAQITGIQIVVSRT